MIHIEDDLLAKNLLNAFLNTSQTHYVSDCPFCGKDKHLYVQRKTDKVNSRGDNRSYMWQCKRGGEEGRIFKLLKKLGCLNILQNYEYVNVGKKLTSTLDDEINLDLDDLEEVHIPLGWQRLYSDRYLDKERGFTNDDYERYKVGTTDLISKLDNYLIFLVERNKKCVGYVCRYASDDVPDNKPKYLNKPDSVKFGTLLFGIDEIDEQTHTVVLVEGVFDKFSVSRYLDEKGMNQVKCVCTFGKKISDSQINELKKYENIGSVFIFYDPDALEDGKKAVNTMEFVFDEVKAMRFKDKDPGEMTIQEIDQAFLSVSKMNFLNFVSSNLN